MQHQKRSELLDAARGIAILIVILGHALQGACGGRCALGLHQFLLSFQMEFFFLVCGVAAAYSSSESLGKNLTRRFLRIGVPYVAWVLLFFLAEAVLGIKQWTLHDAFYCFVFSGFWFLRYLLLMLFAFEIYRFGQRRWNVFVGIFLGLCSGGMCCMIPGQDGFVRYAVFFVLGYAARIAMVRANVKMSFGIPAGKLMHALVWCGRNSLALYAVHWNVFFVFLSLQLVDFSWCSTRFGAYPVAGMLFAVYLFGSIAVIWMMRKFPFSPQVFFGEKR